MRCANAISCFCLVWYSENNAIKIKSLNTDVSDGASKMSFNYVGLEIGELSVLNRYVVHLPSNISTAIEEHLKDLQNSPAAAQIDTVKKLIDCLRSGTPGSFDEHIGYVAFATAISLIKNQRLLLDKYALISHTFESRTCFDHWSSDLIKVSQKSRSLEND